MTTEQRKEHSVPRRPNGTTRPSEAEAFRFSLDLLPEAALVFAIDGAIFKANPPALKLFEASEDELIGGSIYSFRVGKPEQTLEAVEHLTHGAAIHFEMDVLTVKGNQRRLDVLAIPLLTPAGEVEQVLGFGRDITEQRHAEREQAMLAAIVESSEDAIISKAPDHTISTWNSGAEKLYGYSAKEAIGKPVAMMVPADQRDELDKIIADVLQGETIHQYETRRLRKDGALIDVSLSESPVRDPAGTIVGVAAIERDISELLRAHRLESQMASIVASSSDAI